MANESISALLKRIEMFLEDKDWEKADEYCERVLDIEPECAEAYLGKLMAEKHARKKEELENCEHPFIGNLNYEKIKRFGDEALKAELSGYVDFINDRIEKERMEAERITKRNKKIAMIATTILCGVMVVVLINTVIWPNIKYHQAVKNMNAGNFEKAISMLVALGDYRDSKEKITECNYNYGIALMEAKEYEAAVETFYSLGDYEDSTQKIKEVKKQSLATPKVGDSVWIGTYEQDDNTSNGKEDIQWIVLDKKDGKVLVISKYALDSKPYQERKKEQENKSRKNFSIENILRDIEKRKEENGATWESSTIRKWLNGEFLESAFSDEERKFIPTVTVTADENPKYDTKPGKDTKDKVFLLSIVDVYKYFVSNNDRKCKATAYAFTQGIEEKSVNGECQWWLRSTGGYQRGAAIVGLSGIVIEEGEDYDYESRAVRPAMWITIE